MKHLALLSLLLTAALTGFGQDNILDMRENYNIGQVVTVSGIVTSGPELGSVRYIQDDFAGVAIYPGANWNNFFDPVPGDEITVTGEITEFNGLLEIGPSLTEVILESTGNPLPAPALITPSEMDEDYEGQLVQIDACIFDNGGSAIQGNATQNFTSSGQQGVIYVRNSHPMVGEILPISPVGVVGIASQFSFNGVGGYQLLPRSTADFILDSSINLVTAVDQINISQDGFTLTWTTDVAGTSVVEYGLTTALGQVVSNDTPVTEHSLELTGLEPGTIYFCRVSSSNGDDTAESGISPYATVSTSSGDIFAYFTGPVNTSYATIEEAVSVGADMNDTIAEYINRAQHTLDMAIYNINNQLIVNAINDAYDRGVDIRYIAQGTNANLGIAQFDPAIEVFYRTDDNGSGMHNKFICIDADYADLAVLITGSTNLTTENLVDDLNNAIIFHDQSIARGFRMEFDEMWGGDDVVPNALESRFGSEKSVNTPKKYIVGGSPVEVYFSPTDNTTLAIQQAILTANTSLEFALLAFTRDDLAAAVIDRNDDFFCYVRGIIEQTSGSGNEYEVLLAQAVEVYSHEGVPNQLHHKYAIVDQADPGSDPMVITGSHNWSSSAENVNDENTVIVHDARIANIYFQEFMAIYHEFVPINVAEVEAFETVSVFPVPAVDQAYLDLSNWTSGERISVELYDLSGRQVMNVNMGSSARVMLDLKGLGSGIYSFLVRSGERVGSGKLMIQ